jgi:hypothetical protein
VKEMRHICVTMCIMSNERKAALQGQNRSPVEEIAMANLGDPDRARRPAAQRSQPHNSQAQPERISQQGDQDGPQSSQGLDVEPGTPKDKASSQGMADHDFHEHAAQRATATARGNDGAPVNTGGKPGADNTD